MEPWQSRTDPHARARGILETLRYRNGAGESVKTDRLGSRFPVRFSNTEVRTGPAEPVGASTDAVLREVLGVDDATLLDLRSRGILGP